MLRNAFARDENGNIKTKQPCQTPGCNWPVWHICLVGKDDTFPKLLKGKRPNRTSVERSEAAREFWRRRNWERDQKIIQFYKENNVGYKTVAQQLGVGPAAVLTVLQRAAARGEIEMRPRGRNTVSRKKNN